MPIGRLQRIGMAALAMAAGAAQAAGGHHDVDDATILEPGHCQVETWLFSGRQPSLHAEHIGPACEFGGAEWGLNLDGLRQQGQFTGSFGPQVKWVADPAAKRFSIGAALGLTWRNSGTSRPLVSAYLPMTLWLGRDGQLQVHANLGHDYDPSDGHFQRWGLGADWTANDRWTLTAERRMQFGADLSRLGLRYNLTPLLSVDASQARGGATRLWALGVSWEWAR